MWILVVGTGTTYVSANQDTTNGDNGQITRSECLRLPLKSGGYLSLAWNCLLAQGPGVATYSADHWLPAGASGFWSFLPLVNVKLVPTNGRRLYTADGGVGFDGSDVVQAEIATVARRDTTYFTTFDRREGIYFEYFAGSGLNSGIDNIFGRLNRRYDLNGNQLLYSYGNNSQNPPSPLLRKITGDIGGQVTAYFLYADETVDGTHFAPITTINLYSDADPTATRTINLSYTPIGGNSYPYLTKISNPAGCVHQYQPLQPLENNNFYRVQLDMDPDGYTTYFAYSGTRELGTTIEPEGRINYFVYQTLETQLTRFGQTQLSTYDYTQSSFGGQMPTMTKSADQLQNTSYFEYDSTLHRMTKRFDPNGNLTYFEYVGGSAANQFALTKMVSAFNNSQTYFGYGMGADGLATYDVVKMIGPRNVAGTFPEVSYLAYDAQRKLRSIVDPLGNAIQAGRDALGRVTALQDPRGNVTYFNYDATSGFLTSQVDALGNIAYWGYNAFGAHTRGVSPRWKETGNLAGFTTYFEYDQLDRRTKTVDSSGNVTYFDWTGRGDPLDTVDARNTTTAYTYNGLRLLTQRTVTDSAGTQLVREKFGYDIYGNQVTSLDPRGNPTYFGYDAIDRLSALQDALSKTSYFTYDSVGNLTKTIDPQNNTTYYFYDQLSRTTATRDALGDSTYHFYDLANNPTSSVDPGGNPSYFFYDALDRLQVTRDGLAGVAYFYYDGVGNVTATTNQRLKSTYFAYDALSRQTIRQNALGNNTYFTYDAVGNLTAFTDARLSSWVSVFDPLDRRSTAEDPLGNLTQYQYDAIGNVTAINRGVDGYGVQSYGTTSYGGAAGSATYFFYDGLSRPTAVRDALANVTYFFFDNASNRIATRDPLAHPTYFGYDALNRLVVVQNALWFSTYFTYDTVGNLTSVLDADNHAIQTGYDAANRLSAMHYPDGGSSYFSYDRVGNLAIDLNPRGNPTYYRYDALNRAIRLQDALGRTSYFEYDAVSNLSKFISAQGSSSSYTYDAVDQRTNIAYTAAGSDVPNGLSSAPYYVYDPVGNLTQMGDLLGLHRMAYDAGNRLTQHQFPNGSTVYFQFDPRWNRAARIYPGASGTAGSAYDAIDREVQLQAPSGATAYFTYDAASNLTQRILGNNTKLIATYDPAERIAQYRHADKNGRSLTYFDYTRDAKGLITKAVREANYTVYYSYDPNDRLASEIWAKTGSTPSEVYGYRYAYDLAGNRLKARINGANTYYFYDQANQLKVTGTNAIFATPTYYIYDKNGSVTNIVPSSGAATYFAYNPARLVARIKWADATSSYFFYDGQLRRYGAVINGTATYFLWEGMDLLQELNADGTTKEEHTNARVPIPGIGQLVETNRPGQAQQKIYPLMDPRGSITKYIQSDGSTVFAAREYDSFGTLIPNSASGTWPGRFGYQGESWQEIFSANGSQRILMSPTRLYDPTTGRFLQSEISIVSPNWSHYSYSNNSPPQFVDVLGAQSSWIDRWRNRFNVATTFIVTFELELGAGAARMLAGATNSRYAAAAAEVLSTDVNRGCLKDRVWDALSEDPWNKQYKQLLGLFEARAAFKATQGDIGIWETIELISYTAGDLLGTTPLMEGAFGVDLTGSELQGLDRAMSLIQGGTQVASVILGATESSQNYAIRQRITKVSQLGQAEATRLRALDTGGGTTAGAGLEEGSKRPFPGRSGTGIGDPRKDFPSMMRLRYPPQSLTRFDIENCAGMRITRDILVASKRPAFKRVWIAEYDILTGRPKPPCPNCKLILRGVNIVTDPAWVPPFTNYRWIITPTGIGGVSGDRQP
jgi:RHS repeat-associated protein